MLHFAPRYGIVSPCLVWGQTRDQMRTSVLRPRKAANDNRYWGGGATSGQRNGANDDFATREERLLEAALKMFAAHGLSAALRACEAAEIAVAGGDQAGAEWWLAVCATFDSAMARACHARQTGRR
jgi:hypothetical protein